MSDRRWRQIVGMLLWLFVLLMAGCGSETGDRDRTAYIPLTEALGSELLHVDAITVHYGDGNRLSVTDPVEIQGIVSLLKEITLRTSTGTGVGFLYRLELTEGETTVRYASDGMVNGTAYETAHEADDAARTLNKTIVELGRARIPGLLPGVGGMSSRSESCRSREQARCESSTGLVPIEINEPRYSLPSGLKESSSAWPRV